MLPESRKSPAGVTGAGFSWSAFRTGLPVVGKTTLSRSNGPLTAAELVLYSPAKRDAGP